MSSVQPLDHLAALIDAYHQAKAKESDWAQAAEAIAKAIQAEMGDATEATLDGKLVLTWRPTGVFAAKRFAADHPDLVTKYMVTVTRDELDLAALAAEQPELYAAYRARRFERKK